MPGSFARGPANHARVAQPGVRHSFSFHDRGVPDGDSRSSWLIAARRVQPRQQGLEEGIEQGREQGFAQGREQGCKQGREQGVEQQRALLCRMAAARFGASTAARLATILVPIANPALLAEVGDWLVRYDAAGEFLARVDPPSRS